MVLDREQKINTPEYIKKTKGKTYFHILDCPGTPVFYVLSINIHCKMNSKVYKLALVILFVDSMKPVYHGNKLA